MRRVSVGVVVLAAVLFSDVGRAQVYRVPTPAPQVTAANASWQINGEPVFYAGAFYYPAGATVFFDGAVMVRVGTYQTVPLYADATLEPYSIVYVPIGGNVMRPYERRRSGELAGTVGSRTPSFPIERDVERSASSPTTGTVTPGLPSPVPEDEAIAERERRIGTTGTVATSAAPTPSIAVASARAAKTIVQSLPRPTANRGVWIEFDGTQWTSAGDAVTYSADRFTPIGEYYGFPVYRAADRGANEIYIPAVPDGPLTPYRRQ